MHPTKVLHQERRELSSARIACLIGFQKISLKIFFTDSYSLEVDLVLRKKSNQNPLN